MKKVLIVTLIWVIAFVLFITNIWVFINYTSNFDIKEWWVLVLGFIQMISFVVIPLLSAYFSRCVCYYFDYEF